MALTPEGVVALQLSLEQVEESLGFPRGWTETGDPTSRDRRIQVLREHVDGVDFAAISRQANWKPKAAPPSDVPASTFSEQILTSLVRQLEGSERRVITAELAAELLLGGGSDASARDS
ncbi:hypothetical protein ABVQ20_22735 [Mesorhizobium shangrilense]|uniref:Uncharacterized protein n=2 Tax=Mesorhizobium shangrilense TaxID=460060 RepID=A0ABV2DIC4_9HYPH